jgi:hypothetical protein
MAYAYRLSGRDMVMSEDREMALLALKAIMKGPEAGA